MSKFTLAVLIAAALLLAAPAFAIDGQALINQSTVMAAGGFPYNITQSGSYKLSGNLVVPANTNGIQINAGAVTLDLNGFTISGPVVCVAGTTPCENVPSTTTEGIVTQNFGNVAIRNGAVQGFADGIVAGPAIVEDMRVTSNSHFGIIVGYSVLRRSVVYDNGDTGISASETVVTENTSFFNAGYGLVVVDSSFSSNVLQSNLSGPSAQIYEIQSVSGNNNNCDGTTC